MSEPVGKPAQFGGQDWKRILSGVRDQVRRDHLSVVAAGVAFYGFLALFPGLIALISIYGLVADPADVEQLMGAAEGVVPEEAMTLIGGQLSDVAATSAGALGFGVLIGILTALWSANKGTKALIDALNIAYNTEEQRSFIRLNGTSLLITVAAVFAIIIALMLVIAVPLIRDFLPLPEIVVELLRWVVLIALVLFGLAALYRFAPDRRPPQWRWFSWGAAVAALIWLIGSALFSWYVANFGDYNETYGSLATVVILLMWLFVTAFVILLGAEFNSEMERRRDEVS